MWAIFVNKKMPKSKQSPNGLEFAKSGHPELQHTLPQIGIETAKGKGHFESVGSVL
jgi:hypothetical protein